MGSMLTDHGPDVQLGITGAPVIVVLQSVEAPHPGQERVSITLDHLLQLIVVCMCSVNLYRECAHLTFCRCHQWTETPAMKCNLLIRSPKLGACIAPRVGHRVGQAQTKAFFP